MLLLNITIGNKILLKWKGKICNWDPQFLSEFKHLNLRLWIMFLSCVKVLKLKRKIIGNIRFLLPKLKKKKSLCIWWHLVIWKPGKLLHTLSFFTLLPGYRSSHGTLCSHQPLPTNYLWFPTVFRTKSRLWLDGQSPPQSFSKPLITTFLSSLYTRLSDTHYLDFLHTQFLESPHMDPCAFGLS